MDSIQVFDEDLAQNIQDLMFVFDKLIDLDNKGIQTLLRESSSEVLILALEDTDESVHEKIFGNMPKRAAEFLTILNPETP